MTYLHDSDGNVLKSVYEAVGGVGPEKAGPPVESGQYMFETIPQLRAKKSFDKKSRNPKRILWRRAGDGICLPSSNKQWRIDGLFCNKVVLFPGDLPSSMSATVVHVRIVFAPDTLAIREGRTRTERQSRALKGPSR